MEGWRDTCCVLLNPDELVRELLPGYSPDVVVKVPPEKESTKIQNK